MATAAGVRIGIIADTSLQRHVLQRVLSAHGYEVVVNLDPLKVTRATLSSGAAALWLVDLAQHEDDVLIDQLLEWAGTPMLFGEGQAPERNSEQYGRWERRLLGKLSSLIAPPPCTDPPPHVDIPLPVPKGVAQARLGERAEQVWLLAASLGGPAAVKAFLDALPAPLPLGFIYAQHIDAHFEKTLPQAVGRHSQWQIIGAHQHGYVGCGQVVVVPVACELKFAEQGALELTEQPWPEPYSPSVDQMMRNLAAQFGSRCGVIVFSGMGEDGAQAAAYVRAQGAQVWTQEAASCACASMPEAIREAGYAQYTGNPQALAQQVLNHLAKQALVN